MIVTIADGYITAVVNGKLIRKRNLKGKTIRDLRNHVMREIVERYSNIIVIEDIE